MSSSLRNLGEGAFGNVTKEISPDGDSVAVKRLNTSLQSDKNAVTRFQYEVTILQKLKGIPGIIQIFDHPYMGDKNAFSMELGDYSLFDYLQNNNLTDKEKNQIMLKILEAAVGYQERKVTHRDLCPWNIVMFKNDPKIGDFGLALNRSDVLGITRSSEVLGKMHYMAPELANGLHHATTCSDVYSLGRVLELIYNNSEEVDIAPGIFNGVLSRATSQSKGNRQKDAAALLEEFNDVVEIMGNGTSENPHHDYLAQLNAGEAFSPSEFHRRLMIKPPKGIASYNDYWQPICQILVGNRKNAYAQWLKQVDRAPQFTKAMSGIYHSFPNVGWSFDEASSLSSLVLVTANQAGDEDALIEALKLSWHIGYHGNQYAAAGELTDFITEHRNAMPPKILQSLIAFALDRKHKISYKLRDDDLGRFPVRLRTAIQRSLSRIDE